ncbi:IS3 family transposase [Ureibacillus composti]|nr:IS3 family transposase [Ureibacillus composti]MDM5332771.1 IS3 family transposase [Ureibacillus composti]MDM5333243.1 IS3 family transposase [Ureibacillus composti]
MNGKRVTFEFIEEQSENYPVTTIFKFINGVSRSGYYKWKKEKETRESQAEKDKPILNEMIVHYRIHGGNLGNERFKLILDQILDHPINVKRIRRMREQYNLPLLTKKRKPHRGFKEHVKVGNLLNRNFKARRQGIKFSIDISYLEIKKPASDFIFLCAIKDLFNNEIVAYKIGDYQDLDLVLDTVKLLKEKGPEKGAIIHSDQGSQFTSSLYMKELQNLQFTQSMSRRGNCWDNACIESFFGKLKTEMPGFGQPETKEEMIEAVSNYIKYYNEIRPQLKLKMSPVQYRNNSVAA